MNSKEFVSKVEDLPAVADFLISLMDKVAVYIFTGSLGAGKTTLIGTILSRCGVTEPIQSPTFTILQRHKNAQDQCFNHFDLYRISFLDDFLASGFQEYLYEPNSWAFIEWPEIIAPLLHGKVCHVSLEYAGEDKRHIRINWNE